VSPLVRDHRIAANLAIAEKYYDGYHGSVERGRLTRAFDPDDFAEAWIFCSPFLGGETAQGRGTFLAEGSVANHALISQKIPDYKMDDFRAWPTEAGCAWRWRVHGNGLDGNHHEFWEQLFLWTDDEGKIVRFEFYDDWFGFAQTLVYAYDTTLDEFTKIDGYGAAPWNPGPAMSIDPPLAPPRADPPSNERVARNLAIARGLHEGYRNLNDGGDLAALVADDFAEDWVLFSPWLGEVQPSAGAQRLALATVAHRAIRRGLSDVDVDDFAAWPTDDGCAMRWRVSGHAADATAYEFWEQLFLSTDDNGTGNRNMRVSRLECYADWQGFPQMLGRATGMPLDELPGLRSGTV
jgi:hypothetical protein